MMQKDNQDNSAIFQILSEGRWTAYAEDMEFGWRWTIYRDEALIQEGCAVSYDSAVRSVNHTLKYLEMAQNKLEAVGLL